MAPITTRAKLTIVNIVNVMTARTGARRTVDNFHRLSMATITVHVSVLAIQFKLRLGIMIEAPDFPPVGRMAAVAIQPQFAFMGIILFVASVAFDGGIFIRRG
jgi:hypothetical protein